MEEYKGRYFILTGADPVWEEFNVRTITGWREPTEVIQCYLVRNTYNTLKYYRDQFENSIRKGKIIRKENNMHIQHLVNSEYVGGFEIRHEFDIVTDKTPEEILFQEDK